ncbi:hypothetical protein JCM10212_003583, partial [Sporobolomyces blumeae]
MDLDWRSLEPVLTQAASSSEPIADPAALAVVLRPLLKSNNAHLAAAALHVLPAFVDNADANDAHFESVVSSLAPALVDKLGDAKLATRDTARDALVRLADKALAEGQSRGKEGASPWTLVEQEIIEHGFHSKNPKAREQ